MLWMQASNYYSKKMLQVQDRHLLFQGLSDEKLEAFSQEALLSFPDAEESC